MSFFAELKRRNVFRVSIAYCLVAWVVLQVVDFLTELIDAPSWVLQVFFIAAAIGLLAAAIFSWVFEMTPEGLKKEHEVDRTRSITPETGQKLNRIIIVFLAVAVAFLIARPYWEEAGEAADVAKKARSSQGGDESEQAETAASSTRAEKSVAVLPFVAMSSGPDDEYFADGLTEEILNALSQLPELLVTARTSSFAFKGEDRGIQEIAETLGVANVVEGSVRRSGDRIRVTAQLVRADDGFHLWSENYDSTSSDTIEVQEDIATQIAQALDVVMDDERREAMRRTGLKNPEAFVAFQKALREFQTAHGEELQIEALLEANEYFDKVLELSPDYAPALEKHADAYVHIINDAATDEPTLSNLPQDIVDQAYELAVADLSEARENARSLDERNIIEFDLAVITGDFYRVRNRLEAFLDTESCSDPSWDDPIAVLFGYAGALRHRLQFVKNCDPLDATVHFSQIRAALWAGDPEGAYELAQNARGKVSHPWIDVMAVWSLVAQGQYETAVKDMESNQRGPFFHDFMQVKMFATQGNREKTLEMLERVRMSSPQENAGTFFELQTMAVLGEREATNRLAAEVDAQAYGPLPLMLIALWCTCGAPWDLEATPNFAAKLEEGNLPWPPPSPLEFPLKDW